MATEPLDIDIPGFGALRLTHLVSDYNGTLALDGRLLPGVADLLLKVSARLQIHVVTADTFGLAHGELDTLPVQLTIIPAENQAAAKLDLARRLGADAVVALGNGRNDRELLAAARIGIALVQREGASAQTAAAADVLASSVLDALELLLHPKRLTATLRS
ncbi:MAG: hypothetical protein QM586_10985 [Xenophilus sp.]